MFNGGWYARRTVQIDKGQPDDFWPIETDETTGKAFGWVHIGDDPNFRYHREAIERYEETHDVVPLGTYELMGPKVQGNPMGLTRHEMWRHDDLPKCPDAPRTFEGLWDFLLGDEFHQPWWWEGIVWHHPDGRMAKLKVKDLSRTTT